MFKGLRIGQRLIIGFIASLAMTVALAIVAHTQVSSIERSLDTINDVNSVKQRFAINFRGSVHDRAIALRDVTLVEPAELETVIGKINQLSEAYAQSAGPLDELMRSGQGVTPDEQQILTSIKETETRTMPIISEVVKLQRAGQVQPAHVLLMEQARPAFVEWLGRINKFIDLEEAKNKQIGVSVRATAVGFAFLIAGFCGVALLTGAAIAFWSVGAIRPLIPLTAVMKRLADGDFAVEVPSLGRSDEIGTMAATVEVFKEGACKRARLEAEAAEFQRNLDERLRGTEAAFQAAAAEQKRVVDGIASALASLAGGDLAVRVTDSMSAQYQPLKDDFNAAMQSLQETMAKVVTATGAIRSGTGEITHASDDLNRRTEQQAASLQQTATALDEITTTVVRTAEGSKHTLSVVSKTKADAEHSGEVVRQAVAAMGGIEKSSQQIAQVIGVIDEIAFQTNLLALNAGVEAARAGDSGRGFAVVASEVRALAQRSAEAAKEIKTLISASAQQVGVGVKLVGETGEALSRILMQVADISGEVEKIANAAQSQATGLAEVNSAVSQMDQVTQQNAAMVEQSTAATHTLAEETEKLTDLTRRFQLGQDEAAMFTPSEKPRRPVKTTPRPARPAAALRVVAPGGRGEPPHARKLAAAAAGGDSWEEF